MSNSTVIRDYTKMLLFTFEGMMGGYLTDICVVDKACKDRIIYKDYT